MPINKLVQRPLSLLYKTAWANGVTKFTIFLDQAFKTRSKMSTNVTDAYQTQRDY